MNDFQEVDYGIKMIGIALRNDPGEAFRRSVDNIFPGLIDEVRELVVNWIADWRLETYLISLSKHSPSEDMHGRLSMWRAYGNTALVVNPEPFIYETDELGAYSLPVRYLSEHDFATELAEVSKRVDSQSEFLARLGRTAARNQIWRMFFVTVIATKHPGFKEEAEWRVYYRPAEVRPNPLITHDDVVLNGVAQRIWKIRLAHHPDKGLFGADVPNLINRVIVGPSPYPYVSVRAFINLLKEHGVEDAEKKVVASTIPLRTHT